MPRIIRRKQKAVHAKNADGTERTGAGEATTEGARTQPGKPPKKPPLTHFLCTPLVNDSSHAQLEASLQRFRNDVQGQRTGTSALTFSGYEIPGGSEVGAASSRNAQITASTPTTGAAAGIPHLSIAPKAIRPLGTIHLTIGVMSLQSPERVQEAVSLLRSLDLSSMLRPAASTSAATGDATPSPSASASPPNLIPDFQTATSSDTSRTGHSEALVGNASRKHQGGLHDIPSAEKVAGTETCGADVTPTTGSSETATTTRPDVTLTLPTPTVSDARILKVSLRSLQPMQKAQKTSILYAAPDDPSGYLLKLGTELRRAFTDAGVMVKDDRPLKLHATIVNTIYAKSGGRRGRRPGKGVRAPQGAENSEGENPEDESQQADVDTTAADPEIPSDLVEVPGTAPSEPSHDPVQEEGHATRSQNEGTKALPDTSSGHGPDARAPLRFDATALIERYKDFVWAEEITIDKVAICKMGAKKTLNERGEVVNEEYEEVASVAL
ncbi:hypothetical protein W97_07219 [Coniosporium apollinis CBS 100218]|uniref:A-kinase anchor protein 7-like phosphoesterase domain-containing protein n=1 Tax=Coniosporium apollinis (strain CBS 100218) TaxID=1168221 RepID=R7Z2D5_CONA1|nr:uncharacterized protein W97_07219 [Coniosporium apollinis CBS 100218]EON68071.1 hypothetical protein W97_07219 [Coniosporium apollinis CBS 100218]